MIKPLRRLISSAAFLVLTGLMIFAAKKWSALVFAFYPKLSRKILAFLADLTAPIPVPVWELAVCALAVWLVVSLILSLRKSHFLRWLTGVLEIVCAGVFLFVAIWGLNYFAPPMQERLGFSVEQYTPQELREATEYYLAQANAASRAVPRGEDGVMLPGDFSALSTQAGENYKILAQTMPCFDGSTARVKKLLSSNLTWSIVAFILLVIICTIFQHDFLALSWNSNTGGLAGPLITMLQESARYLMIATGMTLVISTAGIDLSVGSVMAVAGAAAMQTLSNGMNVWLSILIALAVGLAIGCVNGALVSFLGLQPFITTLIMMLAGRGMAKVITSGENTDASAVAGNEPLKWFANGFILGIPANFVIAVIIVILVGLLCRKTAMGMMIEAVGINQEASRMTGIKPKKILFLVYAISGFLAAIAGLFATASVMRVDVVKTGQDLEMYAILAVVIGGTSLLGGKFSLAGSAVGAVIIAMIRKTIITLGVNAEATPAFFAVVVIVICVMQAPKIHNLSANMKRKRALKAQAKAVAA